MAIAAAIDIGTNSTKTTLADLSGGIRILDEASEVTRLGKGVDESGRLRPEAMEKTLAAVVRFAELARERGAERIVVIGTSALRDAANGAEFTDAVRDGTGLTVEIISGDREAELAYLAVRSDETLGVAADASLVVFDVGGGSTEVTLGRGMDVEAHRSLDIGAVRITERLLHSDPPTKRELDEAVDLARSAAAEAPSPVGATRCVGIGGTLVNIAAIRGGGADPHGRVLSRRDVDDICGRLASLTVDQRRNVPGLEPARADVIVGGIVIVAAIMERIGVLEVGVSTRGLRFGVLAEIAGRKS